MIESRLRKELSLLSLQAVKEWKKDRIVGLSSEKLSANMEAKRLIKQPSSDKRTIEVSEKEKK